VRNPLTLRAPGRKRCQRSLRACGFSCVSVCDQAVPVRAADIAEPVAVLVALQLADEFSAAGSQAGNDRVDVLTANAMWRIPRVLAGACRLSPWFDGEWNFTSSSRALRQRSTMTPERGERTATCRSQRPRMSPESLSLEPDTAS
jgi:hypothetical protein